MKANFNILREVEASVVSGAQPMIDISGLLTSHPELTPSLRWVGDLVGRQACMTLSRIHANVPYAQSLPKDDYPKLTDAEVLTRDALEMILFAHYVKFPL